MRSARLERQKPELITLMRREGFPPRTAESFLSASAQAVYDAIRLRVTDLDLTRLDAQENIDLIVDELDLDRLAVDTGVPPLMAVTGLMAILPPLLRGIQKSWAPA